MKETFPMIEWLDDAIEKERRGKIKKRKEVKEMDTQLIDDIVNYVNISLQENNMTLEQFLEHLKVCPLCHVKIIECPFCQKKTPLDYKCHRCGKVLPVSRIPELIAKTM